MLKQCAVARQPTLLPPSEIFTMSSPDPSLSSRVRTMQIIAGALLAGCATLLGMAIFLVGNNEGKGLAQPAEGALPIVSFLSLGLLVINTPASLFLPGVLLRKALDTLARRAPDTSVI